jgi:soluble lytic murein transglycosylase-like protein
VESGYNPAAIGGVGEIGLMQILPSTARMLRFVGTASDLAVPETNIHYGVTYLAQAWRLAGGDLCTAVMKYRAGHGETRFSFLSVNYCLAVRSKLAARGFPVTGSVPVATFGEPGRGCGRKCLGVSRLGSVNIAALNTQLSALVMRVRGRR